MHTALSDSAKQAVALAADEARALQHHYVGTEHLLLALLSEGSCGTVQAFQRLGLNVEPVRNEIERLVRPGPQAAPGGELPLTPRAKHVLQLASEEAASVGLAQVGSEHLLIGLIREPDGVAGQVMRNLGLQPDAVRAEALQARLKQIRIIERAVRPLRAGVKHKRKVREELLAHLTAIYQEELAEARDPLIALESAARRFGDPAELSRQLQDAVPLGARTDYYVQRWLGWRAPESVMRMMARTSALTLLIVIALGGITLLVGLLVHGWDPSRPIALRLLAAMAVLMPAAQFGVGVCYFKVRDSLWGAFGARRSRVNAVLWSVFAALIVVAAAIGLAVTVEGTLAHLAGDLPMPGFIATLTVITLLLAAQTQGQTEISDTLWATIDL